MRPGDGEKEEITRLYLICVRVIFLFMAFHLGYNYKYQFDIHAQESDRLIMASTFLLVAVIMVYAEIRSHTSFASKELVFGVLGMVAGLALATTICATIILDELVPSVWTRISRTGIHFAFAYFGTVIGLRCSPHITYPPTRFFIPPGDRLHGCSVLDTSVLIDGRIVEFLESGILTVNVVVPRFVVNELQALSDSADPKKRSRGRRGFDVLQQLQNNPDTPIDLLEVDFEDVNGVDEKLLALCRLHDARLCTVDFNLVRMAEVQQLKVINFNRLAQAMKKTISTGDELEIEIQREGKEEYQGVGYLEDGTMVVVEKGRRLIGRRVPVIVSTVLQTTSGYMVFARLSGEEGGDRDARNSSSA